MNKDTQKDKDIDSLPGVEINVSDDDKNTVALQDERTCTLNNNPRNHKS